MRFRLDPLADLGLQLLDRCSSRKVWEREWAMGSQRRRDYVKSKGLWRTVVGSYRGRHVDYGVDDKAKVRAIYFSLATKDCYEKSLGPRWRWSLSNSQS